jgi:uncharacterized membrane protein YesL
MKLFDVDGPLFSALDTFSKLVLCNLCFVLFSIPVVTIGASLTALYTCTQRLVYEESREDKLVFLEFWHAFRRNFKQATALWLICLASILFLGAYYFVVQRLAGGFGTLYMVTFFFLTLVFLFGFLYVFPLQARFKNTVRNTLRNAWLLSVAALPWTVLIILLIAGAVYVSFIMNPGAAGFFTYLWAVCGFSIVAYFQSFLTRQAFRKLESSGREGER